MISRSASPSFPRHGKPIGRITEKKSRDALVKSNPQAIVDNQPLPYFPRPLATSYRKGGR